MITLCTLTLLPLADSYRLSAIGYQLSATNLFLTAVGCRLFADRFIRKLGNRAFIISARDMERKERKQYGR
jgi:uncharacterized DUF497 family protein